MKWAILLGSPRISGGSYVIFEHAVRALRHGVNVTIITQDPVKPGDLDWHPEAIELSWRTYGEVKDESFDAAIATWWVTAYNLPRINANSYIYFIQSIESRFYGQQDRHLQDFAEKTYQLPVGAVTEASWIRDYLREKYGLIAELVPNGIRKDLYNLEGSCYANRVPGRLRVLVEGSLDAPFKNVKRTIEICRQSTADELWLLTPTPISQYEGIDYLFSQVPIQETPAIYRSCDVLVKLSYVEGMFGPPLEMFHCGGTAIVYNVTGHEEYIRHGYNALVCRKDDEAAVIGYLNRLKSDPNLMATLICGARETAVKWPDWDISSQRFEQVITKMAQQQICQREQILRSANLFLNWFLFQYEEQSLAIIAQARMLEERWQTLQQMDAMISERDKTITAQARMLKERWTTLTWIYGSAHRLAHKFRNFFKSISTRK